MNYTRGPWEVDETDSRDGAQRIVSDFAIIAEIADVFLQDRAGECEANARLIAAVPDLYEFIRDLVNEPERMSDEDMREKTLFEAQELINKAEGK